MLALLSVLLAAKCERNRPIPDGTYVEPSGVERITVRGEEIHFYVVIRHDPDEFLDRTYDSYSVWPNGTLQPFSMRSADAVFGVGQFDWSWDGENIVQKKREGDEVVLERLFILEP